MLPSAVGLSPRNLPWHLLPLSCRRWAVVKGLAVAPATEPATVLTAALPWYLAPELPSLLTLMAAVLTAAPPAAAVACRRAYRCTTVAPAAVLTAAPSAATPANAEPAAVLTAAPGRGAYCSIRW